MHVEKKNKTNTKKECKDLYIDEWKLETYKENEKLKQKDVHIGKVPIKTVAEHIYLGNVIEHDGSNRKNILAQIARGQAAIKDILQILNGAYFGSFYFEALNLLRETMFLTVITHNLEVSFNLNARDLKLLSDLDMQLLRSCLSLGRKSSQTLILLELGLTNVDYFLKKKRIMYLHFLLTSDRSSLVATVFNQQVKGEGNNSWIQRVTKDLQELEINLSFSQISKITKGEFKDIV